MIDSLFRKGGLACPVHVTKLFAGRQIERIGIESHCSESNTYELGCHFN